MTSRGSSTRDAAGARAPLAGPGRLIRSASLGAASLTLAATAHLAGGGQLPAPMILLVAGALCATLATALTARRCHFATLVALLLGEQTGLHVIFQATALHCGGSPHAGHGATAVSCLATTEHTMATMSHSGAGMLLAHGLAVLGTAWLLARGERWWFAAARQVLALVRFAPRRPPSLAAAAPISPRPQPRPGRAPRSRAAPRGPPRVLLRALPAC